MRARRVHCMVVVAAVMAMIGSVFIAPQAGAARQVRGFDGTTIKVGALGNKAVFSYANVGAEARIKRFNDDNEIKGVKLQYVGFSDDKNDPATALSESRKLVTEDQVFAVVGDTSNFNPKSYFTQQHVPFFGWGFENAYCNPGTPTTSQWGFGYNGCQVNTKPARVIDYAGEVYKYVSPKLNKKHPTVALINYDNDSSRATMAQNKIGYKGAGFDVVSAQSVLPAPPTPISDYSPYVSQLFTADHGKAPDVVTCLVATECIQLYQGLQARGFTGIFQHALYTDIFVKLFKGTLVTASNANYNVTGNAALEQMKKDVGAIDPKQKMDGIVLATYASTDMFIQALKKVAKKGKSAITPENVQKAAATQTWEMKGFTGPVKFPVATNRQEPYCVGLYLSDGTQWNTVEPYSCSPKTYPFKR